MFVLNGSVDLFLHEVTVAVSKLNCSDSRKRCGIRAELRHCSAMKQETTVGWRNDA